MIITIGCNRVLGFGHIDPMSGIFAFFDERIIRVILDVIIPAKSNASCKCRLTPICNIDCNHAIHCIISGGNVSYMTEGKRM